MEDRSLDPVIWGLALNSARESARRLRVFRVRACDMRFFRLEPQHCTFKRGQRSDLVRVYDEAKDIWRPQSVR